MPLATVQPPPPLREIQWPQASIPPQRWAPSLLGARKRARKAARGDGYGLLALPPYRGTGTSSARVAPGGAAPRSSKEQNLKQDNHPTHVLPLAFAFKLPRLASPPFLSFPALQFVYIILHCTSGTTSGPCLPPLSGPVSPSRLVARCCLYLLPGLAGNIALRCVPRVPLSHKVQVVAQRVLPSP
jgi:hypothetical protein